MWKSANVTVLQKILSLIIWKSIIKIIYYYWFNKISAEIVIKLDMFANIQAQITKTSL